MAPRRLWKGFLKVAALSCPVGLFAAASTSERIAFHTLHRNAGNRVRRQFVDAETGAPVMAEDQVKGYETGDGDYVVLEPDEIAAVLPQSDKTLHVEDFIRCADIDDLYLDRSYYLAPADKGAGEAFAVLREGMRASEVAALARTVLFRRVRTLLLRVHDDGMIATTLNFDYEVQSAAEAFAGVKAFKIDGEMLDLARHIIETKRGDFDPARYDDRYEAALAALVRAKIEGRPVKPRRAPAGAKVVDLMEALRRSAGAAAGKSEGKSGGNSAAKKRTRGREAPAGDAAATPAKRRAGPKAAVPRRHKAG